MSNIIDLAERRFERLVEALHGRGSAVVAEFLQNFGARHSCLAEIEIALKQEDALDRAVLQALGIIDERGNPL